MSYLYSKSIDFGGNLNIAQLQNETIAAIPSPVLLGITVAQDDVEFAFVSALSPAQQATLDIVVANHVPGGVSGTGTSTGALVLFYDLPFPTSAYLVNFQEIYNTTWQTDFSSFTNPKIYLQTEIFTSGLEIQITSSGTILGSYTSLTTENNNFTITTPVGSNFAINIRRLSRIGPQPILKQLRVTFIN